MAEQGGECERPPHGETRHGIDAPPRKGVRVPVESECEGPARAGPTEGGYVRTRKGHDPMKGTHRRGPQRTGNIGTPEGCDLAMCADRLGPEEGGTCWEGRVVGPSEGHSPLEAAEGIRRDREKSDLARGADAQKESRGRDQDAKRK